MSKYSSYIVFFVISILVMVLYVNGFGPLQGVQQSINDMLCRLTAHDDIRPNVVVVAIDTRTQNEYGPWPWHYDLVADLVAATGGGLPKAVVLDMELPEDSREDSAGHTAVLADQMSWVNNVVLPYDIALATFKSSKTSNPKDLFPNSIQVEGNSHDMSEEASLPVRKVFLPAERLLSAKPRLGFDFMSPDDDKNVRHQSLVMNYDGYFYPSVPLVAAAAYLDVSTDLVKVKEGESIALGVQRAIPINDRSELLICYNKGYAFTRYSAADLLGEKFDYSVLKNKLVVIGVDDPQVTEQFATPVAGPLPEYMIKANAIENIINSNLLKTRSATTVDLIILFALGALGAFILPRISLMYRMVVIVGSIFVLANINYFSVASFKTLPDTIYVLLQLCLFAAASPLLDSQLMTGATTSRSSAEKRKVQRQAGSGRATANAPVRELVSTATDSSELKTVSMSSSDRRPLDHQTVKADVDVPVASTTATPEREWGNIELERSSDTPISDQTREAAHAADSSGSHQSWPESDHAKSASSSGELSISGELTELKSLGRYQITGVLGKGAMGTVYRGVDPAINRPVALKTIRLDFINDPAEFEELKERLYREAQAAGKLSHPNIVTIYDVGSEGPLQYIAMEYLEGQTLENLIRKKVKFNYRIIAQIITQMCQALEYAHERGIVHRDIKPANVMVLSDYRVKVMDFGIARIDSNSMTKTGIAMGTPNYISPEQLKGLPIDRRADLFSLGVVMYEMLLGRRPFKGENITSLIYSILHHEPEKPSVVNPQIPLLFDHIVMRALKKVPAERYQKATELTADLHDFVESFTAR